MTKYHIGKDGTPSICKAQKGNCPFGSETEHYDSFNSALQGSFNKNYDKYGLGFDESLSESNGAEMKLMNEINYESLVEDKDNEYHKQYQNIMKLLRGKMKKNRAGQSYEAYATMCYAKEYGLEHSAGTLESGRAKVLSGEGNSPKRFRKEQKEAEEKIIAKLDEQGIVVNDRDALVKTIYYSDNSDKKVVLMGGSNVLDVAVIDGDEVSMVEVKRTFLSGSQIANTSLSTDVNGNTTWDKDSNDYVMTDKIAEEVSKINMDDTLGENPQIKVSNKESLSHLVNSYKRKQANKLTLITRNKELMEVDLNDSTENIVKTLDDNNFEVKLKIRSNLTKRNANDVDRERWKNQCGKYFKNGEFPKESFAISDINPEYLDTNKAARDSSYVSMGETILPHTRTELNKLPKDTRIQVSDLKVRGIELQGEFRQLAKKKSE